MVNYMDALLCFCFSMKQFKNVDKNYCKLNYIIRNIPFCINIHDCIARANRFNRVGGHQLITVIPVYPFIGLYVITPIYIVLCVFN